MFIYFNELVQISLVSIIASIIGWIIFTISSFNHKKTVIFFLCFAIELLIDFLILLYVPYKTARTATQTIVQEFTYIFIAWIFAMVFYDNALKNLFSKIQDILKKFIAFVVNTTKKQRVEE